MTAGQDTNTVAELAEPADRPGDHPAVHADVALGITGGSSENLDVDQGGKETQLRISSGADSAHVQSRAATLKTSARTSETEPSHAVAPDVVAYQDYQRPSYPYRPNNAPNGTPTRHSLLFRRVAASETARMRQHHGVAEQTTDAAGLSPDEGISAFLGRLLNQLSLSAWLPAAMLVGSLAVLLQLHAQHNHDVVEAVTKLVNRPLGLLVLLLFALLLATMVTQAFEFEVIRLLEGYWGNSLITKGIAHLLVNRQRRKRDRLLRKRDQLTVRAFHKTKLVERQIIPAKKKYIVDLIDDELNNRESTLADCCRTKKRIREAESFPWRQFAPAYLMGRIDAVETQIAEYPRSHRLLPTKLGNVLRAVEDSVSTAQGDDLERFVISHWPETPRALRREHDQYRTRLDLYCMLVFVFLVLAILAPLLITLGSGYLIGTVATASAYLIMSFVSYAAAVASARGYGTTLKAIAGRR
jgi:hypothetical protein